MRNSWRRGDCTATFATCSSGERRQARGGRAWAFGVGRSGYAAAVSGRSDARHRLEYGAVRLLEATCNLVPEAVAQRAGAGLGWLTARSGRPRWAVVMEQLRGAFPEAGEDWRRDVARRCYAHFGAEAVAVLRLSRLGLDGVHERTEVVGSEVLEAARKHPTGAVIVTGHVGNWELCGAALVAAGLPMDVIAARQRNLYFDRYITRRRADLGMTIIPREQARRRVVEVLRTGKSVGIVGDQDARDAGIFVDFFGRPAATARGPAVLARRARALMGTAFLTRLPGVRLRYRLEIEALDSRLGVNALTQACASRLEAKIREHPEQYFWMHRRWKTTPPEPPTA